eukprot:9466699-Pyramimonas_sp.AAC.1
MGVPACVPPTQYSASWPHKGAPPKAPVGVPACAPPIQYSASWPHRELHVRLQWGRPHAPPRTAFRGPVGSSTEGPTGARGRDDDDLCRELRFSLRHGLRQSFQHRLTKSSAWIAP